MKQFFSFLILFVFFTLPSFSQINERVPGYILQYNGDTLHGFIKVRGDILNTEACLFSPEQDGNYKEYSPNDISEYRIKNGKYYVVKEFKLNEKEMKIFVEYLVDGIADLYYFRLPNKEQYLIKKEGEPLTVIEGKVEVKVDVTDEAYKNQTASLKKLSNSTPTVSSKSKSQGQLNYLFREDPAIREKVKNMNFDQRSMIRLTKSYHNKVCKDYDCIIFNKETSLSKKSIGLTVGGTMGNLKFWTDDNTFESLVDVEITRKITPAIGVNYSSTIPYVNTKMLIETYLTYSQHYFEYAYNGEKYQTGGKYSYCQVSLTGLLGYYILKKDKSSFYPSVGITGGLLFNGENNFDNIFITPGYYAFRYEPIPKSKVLINLNAGIHYSQKISDFLEIKPAIIYELMYNMDDMAITSTNHVFYFMIGLSKTLNLKEK